MSPDVVVVGAGAAGILAAWRAATLGARTLLLEKTPRIGTKILISGGGKCNVAHDGPLEEVLRAFRPAEARFLRPACYRLTNKAIMRLMTDKGLALYTRPNGRVFPVDRTAKDVVEILRGYLDEAGVEVRLETPVIGLIVEGRVVLGVRTASDEVRAAKTILCVGGSSYPASGTTGDAWPWSKALGHEIAPIRAALAPIYLDETSKVFELSGVSIRDCLLKARQHGKEIARWRGDLLFTHRGVSGPSALGISRAIAERFDRGASTLQVDVLPDESYERVDDALRSFLAENPKRLGVRFVEQHLASRAAERLWDAAGMAQDATASSVDRKSRNRLVATLKEWTIGVARIVPIEKGECVAGGVSLSEVDPHTMASLISENLYLCGELLDIAGPVGGYNLQAAFSTGFVAGEEAANAALRAQSVA